MRGFFVQNSLSLVVIFFAHYLQWLTCHGDEDTFLMQFDLLHFKLR